MLIKSIDTPILFLVFNRPETTSQVFDVIRQVKPARLYIAADGPRKERAGEAERVAKVNEIATAVDWDCEVKTLFRDKNLGCKVAVSMAITWFFENEEKGIILENDCLPHPDFFNFCDTLLKKYEAINEVSLITGNNFQDGIKRGDGSYYFSRYSHIWGWASWRRTWEIYDLKLTFWPEWKKSQKWKNRFNDRKERKYWEDVFDRTYANKIDTWDYQLLASLWFNAGLTATSNVNLVSNIGFGPDSTHTSSADSPLARMATNGIDELTHPAAIIRDQASDRYAFDYAFGGKKHRFPWSLLRMPRRIAAFVYRKLKSNLA